MEKLDEKKTELLVTMLVQLLVALGIVKSEEFDQVVQMLLIGVGGVVALGTALGYFYSRIKVKQMKTDIIVAQLAQG